MGSSFTIVNNTAAVVHVSSSISYLVFGIAAAAVSTVLMIIAIVFTWGLGGVSLPAYYVALGKLMMTYLGMTAKGLSLLRTVFYFVGPISLIGLIGGAGTIVVGEFVPDMELEKLVEMKRHYQDMVAGMTRLEPGQAYKYSATLSLARDVSVVYDNGMSTRQLCFTGPTANSNNEYRLQDKRWMTSHFVGCWMDAAPGNPKTNWVEGTPYTYESRMFEVRKGNSLGKDGCMKACKGYNFFGLQAHHECWCSRRTDIQNPYVAVERMRHHSECGSGDDKYGEAWRMAIYAITPSPLYEDEYNFRVQQRLIANPFRTGSCVIAMDQRFEPLDSISGQGWTPEKSVNHCQERCTKTSGCAGFTFFSNGGCHLASTKSRLVARKGAMASGPCPGCRAGTYCTEGRLDEFSVGTKKLCRGHCFENERCEFYSWRPDLGTGGYCMIFEGSCTERSAHGHYTTCEVERIEHRRRRLALRDELHEGIELIGDRVDYTGFPSHLTSEELRMDHRRLPAHKQAHIFVEELKPEQSPTLSRRLDQQSNRDHEKTAKRLREWVEMSEDTSPPNEETCHSELLEECEPCVECLSCLEDQTSAKCRTEFCMQCDKCSELPVCKAVSEGCGTEDEVKDAMDNCIAPDNCDELQLLMKCVSEHI